MDDAATQRFIELLTADAEQFRQAAEAWEEAERRDGADRLEDLNGNTIATAAERVQWYRAREREIRQLIERVRHK